jgi:hypothetical protein
MLNLTEFCAHVERLMHSFHEIWYYECPLRCTDSGWLISDHSPLWVGAQCPTCGSMMEYTQLK